MLGSVRGKVGFVPAPDWLIYGTGGLAFAHVKTNVTDTESYTVNLPMLMDPIFSSFTGSNGTSMFGWAAGAGVDWKFWHDAGSAWILGVEYLHYGFGDHTITLADNTGSNTAPVTVWNGHRSISFNATERVDTIKGRISYLFSIH
jgi:opacity protein-like surface antigen